MKFWQTEESPWPNKGAAWMKFPKIRAAWLKILLFSPKYQHLESPRGLQPTPPTLYACLSVMVSGGSRGAQQARAPPPKIGSTVIFYNPFCIRMVKIRAQIALESIKNP